MLNTLTFHEVAYRVHCNPIIGRILKTRPYLLDEALQGCPRVLDLGCGPSSLLQHCHGIEYSVGVEVFQPYLDASAKAKIHDEYIAANLCDVEFPDRSFDAVFLGEVIEHLPEPEARVLLAKAERWARKKVVVTTPNGFTNQPEVDGNAFQRHLSGWDVDRLSEMGYDVRGLWGWKALMNDHNDGDIFQLVKFRPRYFWFGVLALTQTFTYYSPRSAFALFAVKKTSAG